MSVPFIMGRNSITVMVNGATHTITDSSPNYLQLREAVKNKDWDAIPDLVSPVRAIETYCKDNVTVKNGEVFYRGSVLHNAVTQRIIEMMNDGFDANPLVAFLDKLMSNTSRSAVNELYDWLERTSLPITEDGDFLAYKKVRSDYKDFYTGKMDNSVGQILEMPRNQVDDKRNRTCSYGLHFCSLSYLPSYHGGQGRVMIVKVNPADVVSIPNDYDYAKGRACRYEIIGEHNDEHNEAYTTPVVSNDGVEIASTIKKTAAEAEKFMVMGIDFGNADRAKMVTSFVDNLKNNDGSDDRTVEQARIDGFDDATFKRGENLNRYNGHNLRSAVEYARAYFEGHDRHFGGHDNAILTNYADDFDYETDYQREEINRVMNLPLPKNTDHHGYDNGYDVGIIDGIRDRKEEFVFDLHSAENGGTNYRRGYIEGYTTSFNDPAYDDEY
jgi:hypothetical protein